MPNPWKRLRVGSINQGKSSHAELKPLSPIFDAKSVPEEDLKELFSRCDLPSRCRFRRVCRYWKHLVSQPEVNKAVFIDWSCLVTEVDTTTRRKTRPSVTFPVNFWRAVWPGQPSRYERHGLMGPHVRLLVYQGHEISPDRVSHVHRVSSSFNEYMARIREIGQYCVNLTHLVLRNVSHSAFNLDPYGTYGAFTYGPSAFTPRYGMRSFWIANLYNNTAVIFPDLHSVTLLNHVLSVSTSTTDEKQHLPWMYHFVYRMEIAIPRLHFDWSDDPDAAIPFDLNAFLWPYPSEQRDWVARWAPRLPQRYYKWAAGGRARRKPESWRKLEECITGKSDYGYCGFHLGDQGTYTSMPVSFLRMLASFILHEKPSGFAPPPHPFPEEKYSALPYA